MIIKTLSRRSNPAQLIRYALRYTTREGAKQKHHEHAAILLRHNIRSRSLEGYIREFKENESYRIYRRKDSVILFHSILSLSPKDKSRVTKEMLKDLARKFVELRGSNCLNIAVSHSERKNAHIHVLTSGVQVNGRSVRVSKEMYARILREMEMYQASKYPQLIHSQNTHTKEWSKEELVAHIQNKRQSKKQTLQRKLETTFRTAKSLDELTQQLAKKGLEPYFRNGRFQGIRSEGIKYRLSNLGIDKTHIEALQQKEQKSTETLAELRTIRNRSKQHEMEKKLPVIQKAVQDNEKELKAIRSIRNTAKSRGDTGREMIEHNGADECSEEGMGTFPSAFPMREKHSCNTS